MLPEKGVEEPDDKFVDRLEEWDSKNHQNITWFLNTSTPSINLQLGRYDTAKEVWDLLAKRASLLHQSPLPTLDNAISRFLFDETHLKLLRPQQVDTVLATMNSNSSKGGQKFCHHCNKLRHVLYECNLVECHKSAASENATSTMSIGNLETLFGQMLSSSALSTSTALSIVQVRALLLSSSCLERFWGEAALKTVYIINRIPYTAINNKSPYECLHGVLPTYNLLKVFGCACFVLLPPHEHNKLEPRAQLCCLLGYGIQHKDFKVSSSYQTPLFTNPSLELFFEDDAGIFGEFTNEQPTIMPSPNEFLSVDTAPKTIEAENIHVASSSNRPTQSYKEASSDPLWQQVMQDELQALEKTGAWDLVDLPIDKTLVGCKWVYKIKTCFDGFVERYKVHLVAIGFTQEYGIDYEETFAPVACLTTVRSLLVIAAIQKWKVFQMDVKNSFLNGDLTEEVYMKPPPSLDHPPHKVCKLRRALYGLKQSLRAWFAKFSAIVSEFGFSSSPYGTALFIRKIAQGMILLLLYVDDMIITRDDISGICELKHFFNQKFKMKDLGPLSYFLGLEVTSSNDGYLLSQAKYASDLISRAGLIDSKIASTPLEPNARLTPMDGFPLRDPTVYQQLVGSLVYLTITRLNIAYAVHIVSQFMATPRSTHYAIVLHIIHYVKGTLFLELHFSTHSSLVLCANSDADWAGDPIDRKSTTGYCLFLGDSLISWCSKKETFVSRSSTEAEYRALANTVVELLWICWLLEDMGVS
ncbi:hypothetical protein SLEP1_g14354 [Rubroshorea leprosula]|uniref:Reverse transcriptase Ty1/copia-type domain-containing protein n=1 Tax=Rubroshorea leprosula TaxID=152421 RepID=A0AAV5IIR4_9ROSI|nr:hypothetical protein SLEP1_g14354 [Rubroshorea leprosula]